MDFGIRGSLSLAIASAITDFKYQILNGPFYLAASVGGGAFIVEGLAFGERGGLLISADLGFIDESAPQYFASIGIGVRMFETVYIW